MKITVEPGNRGIIPDQHSVSFDTNGNAETTGEAVDMALQALVAYGHHIQNVALNAIEWGESRKDLG